MELFQSLSYVGNEEIRADLMLAAISRVGWDGMVLNRPFSFETRPGKLAQLFDEISGPRLVVVRQELDSPTNELKKEWGRQEVETPETTLYVRCVLRFFHPRWILDAFNRIVPVSCSACEMEPLFKAG